LQSFCNVFLYRKWFCNNVGGFRVIFNILCLSIFTGPLLLKIWLIPLCPTARVIQHLPRIVRIGIINSEAIECVLKWWRENGGRRRTPVIKSNRSSIYMTALRTSALSFTARCRRMKKHASPRGTLLRKKI
jgi:hypothetical protein